jgi:uncharacterized GH25 family protein
MRRLSFVGLFLWAQAAWAHEFWLMPTQFELAPGVEVGLQLRVGSGWPGETRAYDADRALRFEAIDALGHQAVRAKHGAEPAGHLQARRLGQMVVAYRSDAAQITLPAARFEAYLRDEGLQHVVAIRTQRGEAADVGVERYSRCAKALLQVGGDTPPSAVWHQPVGLTLELTPQGKPQVWRHSRRLTLQVRFKGQPLAGLWVKAMPQDKAVAVMGARTDSRGHVVFDLPATGVWLFNTVHMFDAAPDSGARWESVWSSLTLQIRLQLPAASSAP